MARVRMDVEMMREDTKHKVTKANTEAEFFHVRRETVFVRWGRNKAVGVCAFCT